MSARGQGDVVFSSPSARRGRHRDVLIHQRTLDPLGRDLERCEENGIVPLPAAEPSEVRRPGWLRGVGWNRG